jgi:hypothetical protein
MSRAFTKETAESAPPPERMVDDGPNPVTPEGLAQIDAHIARLESAMATEANVLLRETVRPRRAQRASKSGGLARAVERREPRASGCAGTICGDTLAGRTVHWTFRSPGSPFGSTVTIRRKGREQTFRIVGADQADPARGLISFRSPMAAAIMGADPGEVVEAGEPLGEIEVVKLRPQTTGHSYCDR